MGQFVQSRMDQHDQIYRGQQRRLLQELCIGGNKYRRNGMPMPKQRRSAVKSGQKQQGNPERMEQPANMAVHFCNQAVGIRQAEYRVQQTPPAAGGIRLPGGMAFQHAGRFQCLIQLPDLPGGDRPHYLGVFQIDVAQAPPTVQPLDDKSVGSGQLDYGFALNVVEDSRP